MESDKKQAGSKDFSNRRWSNKFQIAIAGLAYGIKGRRASPSLNSFVIHIPAGMVVVVLAAVLGVGWISMAILLLCIGIVMVTELVNTSLELIAKAITGETNEHVAAALDVASGAVLMASLTATVVGVIVFGWRLSELLGW